MHFAETFQKDVARLRILLDCNRGIFFKQLVETADDFIFFTLLLCGNRKADARLGEFDLFYGYDVGCVAQRTNDRPIEDVRIIRAYLR